MWSRQVIAVFTLTLSVSQITVTIRTNRTKEYIPYDGWYNNLANPSWGVADSILVRKLPPSYHDGVYSPSGEDRPNPRAISNAIMKGESGLPSVNNKTVLFVFFGQHVFHEIVNVNSASCPPVYFNIPVPTGDTHDPKGVGNVEMPYQRSRYSSDTGHSPNHPREQLNSVTSFLDGGSIYGSNRLWCTKLRLLKNKCPDRTISSHLFASQSNPTDCRGELSSLNDEGYFPLKNDIGLPFTNLCSPKYNIVNSSKRFFRLGSTFANENPFLLTFGILWFRNHNWWARRIRDSNPDWSDEDVFKEARIRNIAEYQNIVMYEWLPVLLGECNNSVPDSCGRLPKYTGYKSDVLVGITNVFQSAAIHYMDSLVPPGVFIRGKYNKSEKDCPFFSTTNSTSGQNGELSSKQVGKPAIRFGNTYWVSNEDVESHGTTKLLLGMASQISEKEDNIIVSDIRESYYGPREFTRVDGVALSIQKGRDHGLPNYVTARKELGLSTLESFEQINYHLFQENEKNGGQLLKNLKTIHNDSLNAIDVLTGGLLETTNGNPGELFQSIFLEQFQKLRDGDRFWFENINNGLFTNEEVQQIRNTSILDVIMRTHVDVDAEYDLQDHPFQWNAESGKTLLCGQKFQLKESDLDECTELKIYDNFEDDKISFVIVFSCLVASVPVIVVFMRLLGQWHQYKRNKRNFPKEASREKEDSTSEVTEVLGTGKSIGVTISFEVNESLTIVHQQHCRKFKVTGKTKLMLSNNSHKLIIRLEDTSYDIILSFEAACKRAELVQRLKTSFTHFTFEVSYLKEKHLMRQARTKEDRDKKLQKLFCMVLKENHHQKSSQTINIHSSSESSELFDEKITRFEFSEFLKVKEDNLVLMRLFEKADTDNDGLISCHDFNDMNVLFRNDGDPESKLQIFFDLFRSKDSERLSAEDFKTMVKSLADSLKSKIDIDISCEDMENMLQLSGCFSENGLTLEGFLNMLKQYDTYFTKAFIDIPDSGQSSQKPSNMRKSIFISNLSIKPIYVYSRFKRFIIWLEKYVQYNALSIFWLSLYSGITIGVFCNSFYSSASNKASGFYDLAGYAVPLARGAAGALMFNFSTLLLTMCRNIITMLRDTFLHQYIPFDEAVTFHKIVAWMGLGFTVIHIAAHGVNFYSISTHSPSDLLCLFRDYWYPSDFIPSFMFWCTQTITGITGILLSLIIIIIYVFACDFSRRLIYNWFHWTHFLGYISFYFFCVLHGSAMMVQSPSFYLYFLGPAILYTLDKLYSLSKKKIKIPVLKAELLPSDVTFLEFKRPLHFSYKAGQWVRIASLSQSSGEYHPFTLTSAPHEKTLKLHIRAVGPWTKNLRQHYSTGSPYPELYLEGPFGEGHQDWYKFDVSVLVGGGIGVTPFASILKDLINNPFQVGMKCRKVYFIWITRDQKQYEWLTDIIQEVEENDVKGILDTHIFITQFPQKFDLRTTMLYACENHFQKIVGKSLFTGLKSETHFGRPNFNELFELFKKQHTDVKRIGVFSCGPPPMTNELDKTCGKFNKMKGALFCHHYENF